MTVLFYIAGKRLSKYKPHSLKHWKKQHRKKQKATGLKVASLASVGTQQTTSQGQPQLSAGSDKPTLLHYCEYCGKVYRSRFGLKVHVDSKHKAKFRFTCEVCGKGLNNLWNYRGHINKHSEKIKEKCDTCGKLFTYRTSLLTHKKRCGEPVVDVYICPACGVKFYNKRSFWDHQQGLHGNRNYQCHMCSKMFKWRSSLSYHMKRVHKQ